MFKLLLIWRYFLRRQAAYFAVAAVALVVMLAVVVLSILSGLVVDIKERNHLWTGDAVIRRDSLVGFPYYQECIERLSKEGFLATPVIKTYGLLNNRRGVQVMGIKMAEFCRVTGLQRTLDYQKENPSPSLTVPQGVYRQPGGGALTPEQRRRGCILGRYLLESGLASSRCGLTLFGLNSQGVLTGSESGEHQTFWYVDESKTNLVDIDSSTVYVDFEELQKMIWMQGTPDDPSRASEIRVRFAKGMDPQTATAKLEALWQAFQADYQEQPNGKLLADAKVQDWKEYRRSRIAPAENEKRLMVLVFAMIGTMGVFVIFAIFYLIVTDKIKDLGILKSMGGSSGAMGQIFLGYGLLVGIVGSALGLAAGWAVVTYSNAIEAQLNAWFGFQLWDPQVYAIDRIPDAVYPHQAAWIVTLAILASVVGALAPAWRAMKLEVVDALRVE